MGDTAGCCSTLVPATASVLRPFPDTILDVPPCGCPPPPKYEPMELVPCLAVPFCLEEDIWCWDIPVGPVWARYFRWFWLIKLLGVRSSGSLLPTQPCPSHAPPILFFYSQQRSLNGELRSRSGPNDQSCPDHLAVGCPLPGLPPSSCCYPHSKAEGGRCCRSGQRAGVFSN